MKIPFLVYRHGADPGWHLFDRPIGLMAIIAYKTIWGLAEILGGVIVLNSTVLIAIELAEDPQDLLINWIVNHVHYTQTNIYMVGGSLIALGIGKLVLAIGLWYRSSLIRDLGIIFFTILAAVGLYEIFRLYTPFRLFALVMDMLILWYFWKILPKHLHHGQMS